MTKRLNHEAVYRTAPATQGLLIMNINTTAKKNLKNHSESIQKRSSKLVLSLSEWKKVEVCLLLP